LSRRTLKKWRKGGQAKSAHRIKKWRKRMSIKGVSEVIRLPRLGKIRLGFRHELEDGSYYLEPTDYFVCPEEVKKVYGEKPTDLRIMFPTNDRSQWASQFLRCYSASRSLLCRGDGETALARIDVNTGKIATLESLSTELKDIPCMPVSCPMYRTECCRRVMNLQFLLPDCPGFGVYQLDVSSRHSIINVNSGLELVHGVCERVAMIPLSLKLILQEVEPDGIKKMAYVLSLTAPYTLSEIQKYAQIPPGQALVLPPPDVEAPDDFLPVEELSQSSASKNKEQDNELILLWDKAKRLTWQIDIQDYQVAHYFAKYHQMYVHLKDFDYPLPPGRFSRDTWAGFHKTSNAYP
jgi:hypothetical protein